DSVVSPVAHSILKFVKSIPSKFKAGMLDVRDNLQRSHYVLETNQYMHWPVLRQDQIDQLRDDRYHVQSVVQNNLRAPPPLLMRRRVSLPVSYFSPLYCAAAGT